MDYCSIVWGSSCFVDRLSLLQKKAARIILDISDDQFPSIQMLKELNWMTVQDRINFRKVTMVFRSLNFLAPSYMTNMFKFVSDINQRHTRSSNRNDLYLAGGRHKLIYMNGFYYSSVKLWNNLKTDIRCQRTLNAFKSSYLKYFYTSSVNIS